jgi:hypothetical protein
LWYSAKGYCVLWYVAGNVSNEPIASIVRAEYEGVVFSETVTPAKVRRVFQKTKCSYVAQEHIRNEASLNPSL